MVLGQSDAQAGFMLVGLGVAAIAGAAIWLARTMRSFPFPYPVSFWWSVNYVLCRVAWRLRRVGACTVPPEGPVIIVANHTCGIDPLVLAAAIPHRVPAYMIAEEFSNPPIGGWAIRAIECIPVRRDGQDTMATRAALRHLRAGKALAIFIEGRIVPPGEVSEAKDGATVLALHSGATVVPAHISGTIWDDSLVMAFFRPHKAVLRFGEPINLREMAGPRPDKDEIPRLSAMLLERIRRLPLERPG